MPCFHFKDGYLCLDKDPINLEPFGAKVWMLFHRYCGPSFFRSENCITIIRVPSKKTWDAFYKWEQSIKE